MCSYLKFPCAAMCTVYSTCGQYKLDIVGYQNLEDFKKRKEGGDSDMKLQKGQTKGTCHRNLKHMIICHHVHA